MSIANTAGLTAVWRQMSKVDRYAKNYTSIYTKILGYLLGKLDPDSVRTIAQRTVSIDNLIKKINPKTIVEIGSGFSSRPLRFNKIKFYELDLPKFKNKPGNSKFISFVIGKDNLNLDIKNAMFIVEGVAMYLNKEDITKLLKQIKKYNGHLIIDFFNRKNSRKEKTIREELFRFIFKKIIKKKHLFNYKIKNIEDGKSLLRNLGFKRINIHNYKIKHTLDVLFDAQL